ncbi:hypothetical protein P154DRAFT_52637 [Amniculicola lignicola CBS 123094]|uniref:Uncharacterized protein n=1 Tax=Amniculicola lignicola CBS 123094 TaxID=1392246 RepID=A0A6A5WVR8_9PLEO|nr:hypothetical protein P154DRAFT_52637 [Amniculicola lignicola CBS 123094]
MPCLHVHEREKHTVERRKQRPTLCTAKSNAAIRTDCAQGSRRRKWRKTHSRPTGNGKVMTRNRSSSLRLLHPQRKQAAKSAGNSRLTSPVLVRGAALQRRLPGRRGRQPIRARRGGWLDICVRGDDAGLAVRPGSRDEQHAGNTTPGRSVGGEERPPLRIGRRHNLSDRRQFRNRRRGHEARAGGIRGREDDRGLRFHCDRRLALGVGPRHWDLDACSGIAEHEARDYRCLSVGIRRGDGDWNDDGRYGVRLAARD